MLGKSRWANVNELFNTFSLVLVFDSENIFWNLGIFHWNNDTISPFSTLSTSYVNKWADLNFLQWELFLLMPFQMVSKKCIMLDWIFYIFQNVSKHKIFYLLVYKGTDNIWRFILKVFKYLSAKKAFILIYWHCIDAFEASKMSALKNYGTYHNLETNWTCEIFLIRNGLAAVLKYIEEFLNKIMSYFFVWRSCV